jgi:hypothetical protein
LKDSEELQERTQARKQAPWSGYYFVNIGEGQHRNWDDCVNYRFLGAGQGEKYSNALNQGNSVVPKKMACLPHRCSRPPELRALFAKIERKYPFNTGTEGWKPGLPTECPQFCVRNLFVCPSPLSGKITRPKRWHWFPDTP